MQHSYTTRTNQQRLRDLNSQRFALPLDQWAIIFAPDLLLYINCLLNHLMVEHIVVFSITIYNKISTLKFLIN